MTENAIATDLSQFSDNVRKVVALKLKSKTATLTHLLDDIDQLKKEYAMSTLMETASQAGLEFDSLPSFTGTIYRIKRRQGK
ncbi:hypothetical protein ACO0LB_18065 [Undibacterium sp. SXout7W]|uniref:hypothetical protein n=1 Tax=Undibacterium sp. SXout7W TaxID=3413049 RepID=UPI003BF10659